MPGFSILAHQLTPHQETAFRGTAVRGRINVQKRAILLPQTPTAHLENGSPRTEFRENYRKLKTTSRSFLRDSPEEDHAPMSLVRSRRGLEKGICSLAVATATKPHRTPHDCTVLHSGTVIQEHRMSWPARRRYDTRALNRFAASGCNLLAQGFLQDKVSVSSGVVHWCTAAAAAARYGPGHGSPPDAMALQPQHKEHEQIHIHTQYPEVSGDRGSSSSTTN